MMRLLLWGAFFFGWAARMFGRAHYNASSAAIWCASKRSQMHNRRQGLHS